MTSPIDQYFRSQLQNRRDSNSLRQLPALGDEVDFCSNDYLGFALERFQSHDSAFYGATGSRLISGNHEAFAALEGRLAAFFGSATALVYNSGYQANLGLLSCIATRHDTIIYDQLVHASIRDALHLSNARNFAFRHNDPDHLRKKLERAKGRVFVVVESVYSMDGDEAPLRDIATVCADADAALIVDEAHAVGVLGPQGRGLTVELGLEDQIWARVITFGKAVGTHGAAILGSSLLRDFLINFSRPFIYTTGLPPHTVHRIGQVIEALSITDRIRALHSNIKYFKSGLNPEGDRRLIPSRSAIHALIVPGNDAVKSVAAQLRSAGLRVLPILYPTVPKGEERLRVCLHSFNRPADIAQLAQALNALSV